MLSINDAGIEGHVLAFVLNTIREHKRDQLSAETIQGRMDEKFNPNLHNAIWRELLAAR